MLLTCYHGNIDADIARPARHASPFYRLFTTPAASLTSSLLTKLMRAACDDRAFHTSGDFASGSRKRGRHIPECTDTHYQR